MNTEQLNTWFLKILPRMPEFVGFQTGDSRVYTPKVKSDQHKRSQFTFLLSIQ